MGQDIRPFVGDRDLKAVDRIWREVGWLGSTEDIETLDWFLEDADVEVAMLNGEAECAVAWVPGSIRYQQTNLPLCAVTAVTTSRIGRKQGFATTMTARAIRAGATAGAAVAALGIFDQGFYDRIGFGTSSYEHQVSFDPVSLDLDHIPYRPPVRLGPDDHGDLHRALVRRHRSHGAIVLDPPAVLRSECAWVSNPFGLGYRDGDRVTHFVYGSAKGEHGPYRVTHLAYEESYQLLELLRLLKELGDQVTTMKMLEPAEIQLQDLVRTPFRKRSQTATSPHATGTESVAWMQLRILDLEACVGARSWPGQEVRFNLSLSDPAPGFLDGDWPGVAGDHVITIGPTSSIKPGSEPTLDRLSATVNAFSRAWFGVRPATSLTLTDELDGPPQLLRRLDEALALPPPKAGWNF